MDGGEDAIEDREELATVRRQARKVHRLALAAAVLLTALGMALP
jgi:hypothetical protein